MTMMISKTILSVLLLLLASCTTIPNESPPPISVPKGLTNSQIQLALMMSIADKPLPPLSPGQQITDNVLTSLITGYESATPRQYWYFEDSGSNVVYAGFQRKNYYMRIAIKYDNRKVALNIEDSRNLRQTEFEIHKRAFQWLQTLENRIRRNLGSVAKWARTKPQSEEPQSEKPGELTKTGKVI